jgi:signal transduction histidine kinase/CheY-like chemotaxis protein
VVVNTEQINILLVDDHVENLLALSAVLEVLGQSLNLITASSGEDALRYLLSYDFAVILLDTQMPGMNGFEMAAIIKERERSQRTPIIFVTAYDRSDAQVFKGYSIGAVDYLFKPVEPEILRAKVANFVDLYRKTQEVQQQSRLIAQANRDLTLQLEEIRRLNDELENTNDLLEREIAERKQAQEAVQRSENLYRTLAKNLPQTSVFLFDQALRYLLAEGGMPVGNGRFTFSLEEQTVWEVLPTDQWDFWIPCYRAVMDGREQILEKSIENRVYFIHMLPVKNEYQQIFAGLGMIRDITDFKRTEDALREANDRLETRVRERTADLKASNEELSSFAYIVSHDLRSPLVNLKGFSSELRSCMEVIHTSLSDPQPEQTPALAQVLDHDIPEALGYIEAAITHMDHLTSAVLRLSRLGRRELHLEVIDVNELAQIILGSLAHQIRQQQVKVKLSPLPEALADRSALEQILGNILTNAVLYLKPDHPGEIEISGERTEQDTIYHVRDNGRGIADEDQYKVFEPFRRAGRPDVPGEGMGLAYVQILVRRHGGHIWYTSQVDAGTIFSFSLPLAPSDEHNE